MERRDVPDRPVNAGDMAPFEETTIRVPIRGEEAFVTKQTVVTGEVVVNKDRVVEREQLTETVRRVQVEVDEQYEKARPHLQEHFRGRGTPERSWEEAEPTYRYGYASARDARYAGKSFEEVEPELRRSWGDDDAQWQRLREEVREGFRRGRAG